MYVRIVTHSKKVILSHILFACAGKWMRNIVVNLKFSLACSMSFSLYCDALAPSRVDVLSISLFVSTPLSFRSINLCSIIMHSWGMYIHTDYEFPLLFKQSLLRLLDGPVSQTSSSDHV